MEDSFFEFCGGSIFNESLLLNNSYPKFTDCFQNTLLVWVPCGWLWFTLPVYLYYLLVKADGVSIPFTCLNMSKMSFSLVLFFLAVVSVVNEASNKEHGESPTTAVFLAGSIKASTFLLTALIIQLERVKGFITSGVLWIFWFLLTIAEIIPFYTHIIEETYNKSLFKFTMFYIYCGVVLLQFILHCIAEKRMRQEYHGLGKPPCPEVEASFLSRILFWWMNTLTIIGFRREIEETDLWELNPRDHSSKVHPPFFMAWEEEAARCRQREQVNIVTCENEDSSMYSERTPLLSAMNSNYSRDSDTVTFKGGKQEQQKKKQPSLFKVLVKVFGLTILASWGCKLLYDLLQFVSPMILNVLIGYVENKSSEYRWKGFVYASSFFVVAIAQSLFFHQNFQIGMTCGMQMKSALIAAIYKKAITMNNEARKSSTVGEIVNLMSVDCERVQMVVGYLWMMWSSPLQIALAITLLYYTLGSSVFAGLGVLVLLIPINAVLAMKQRKLQVQQMRLKDSRIKLMNEVLNGIKVLKLYAWELSFQKKVMEIRAQELANLKKTAYLGAVTSFFWSTAPFLVTLATFTTYVLASDSHYLDAQKAFVSLSLFNILRFPINLMPQMISYIVQCQVSIKRIGKFLSHDDINPDNVTHLKVSESAIKVENGTFRWDKDLQPQLKQINLEIPEGKLVAVVGQVGSGKSSLISAFLGEMEKLSGNVYTKGSIAYVSQQAWIQNAALKDNILFFKPIDEHKYQQLLEACALLPDLDILPAGDMTEIGEKGINLSGGQKQRISLARAVYNNADIYLLDDPLSAVDSHVGKHIFNKVIGENGLLRNKTRVLVTHGVQWLPVVDTIVVLVNGEITEVGSYEELLTHDGPFAQFLKTYLRQEEEDEDPEIQKIKSQILEKVDSVTSEGTGITFGDDDTGQVRKRERRKTSESSTGKKPLLAKSISTKDSQPPGEDKSDTTMKMPTKPTKPGDKLIEKEMAETGQVKFSVYLTYFKAVGGISTFLIFGLFILYNAASVGSNIWLSLWTDDKYLKDNAGKANSSEYQNKNYLYLGVYGAFGLAQAIIILIYSLLYAVRAIRASAQLHERMLAHILRSPMEFFETTPTGRIVNRFSRDVETIDNSLPWNLRMWMNMFFTTVSTIVVISYSTPIFLSVVVPLAILYYMVQRFYIPTARQLKRIESTTRSPIYTQFGETLTGASTIRAYGLSQTFIDKSRDKVDYNLVSYYAGIASNRWLGFRLEFLGNFIVLAAAMFAVVSDSATGGLVGLSISYALQVTGALNFMVRTTSDLETSAVSVERVKEYTETKSEADWIIYFRRPPHNWPEEGDVQFENYTTRYREGLDLVLKGITCNIKGGEKIGIVGRTGAGKSSFTLALFRLIEASGGAIVIDGQRISDMGLHDLRSKLTILPQDPVLFSGTLRMNLDPFDSYTDVQIWAALEHSHLKTFVSELPEGLNHECGEGGQNLSVGQRQLVCLARTLLRKTKILILDEATAAVDMETDDLIQKTIRTEFKDCTVLTIAHRLNTIMDYDRIMVLDLGLMKEFDTPENLLKNKSSIFYGMAKDANLIHGDS